MTDINELVKIINDCGGAASIDEILERYKKKHPMIIMAEHKATAHNTLTANPRIVSFNEELKKWETKEKDQILVSKSGVRLQKGLDSREKIVDNLSKIVEGTEAQIEINYKDKSADIVNVWKKGDSHKSGFAKNKKNDLFRASVNNEYAFQIAKLVLEFPRPTREKAGQQYYTGLTFEDVRTIVCIIAGRYELIDMKNEDIND